MVPVFVCLALMLSAPVHATSPEPVKLGITLTNYKPTFLYQLAQTGVRSVRLFDIPGLPPPLSSGEGGYGVLDALQSVGIDDVTINVNNQAALDIVRGGFPGMENLVAQFVKNYTEKGMQIRVAVGSEPLAGDCYTWTGSTTDCNHLRQVIPDAVEKIVKALQQKEISVPVTVPLNFGVLTSTYPPQISRFKSDFLPTVARIAKSINASGSEFMIHAFPWGVYAKGDAPLDVALGNVPPYKIEGRWYSGMLSQQIQAFRSALDKLGYPDAKVLLGETGWPTRDEKLQAANPDTAKKYFDHLTAYAGTRAILDQVKRIFVFSDMDAVLGPPWDRVINNYGLFTVNVTNHSCQKKYDFRFPHEPSGEVIALV